MVVFLVIVAGLAVVLGRPLLAAFMGNPAVNGVILGHPARRHRLHLPPGPAARTGQRLDRRFSRAPGQPRPDGAARAGAAAARRRWRACSGSRQSGRVSLSATSLQTLLDGIASRLDETRETSRYLIGVLVFLGLLGTFYGLLETVRSVGDVIGALNIGGERSRPRLCRSEDRAGIAAARHVDGVQRLAVRPRRQPRPGLSRSAGRAGAEPLLQRPRGMAVDLYAAVRRARSATAATARCRPICRRCSSRPPTAWKTCSASWRAARKAGSAPTRRSPA